jgi:hypothetical protein
MPFILLAKMLYFVYFDEIQEILFSRILLRKIVLTYKKIYKLPRAFANVINVFFEKTFGKRNIFVNISQKHFLKQFLQKSARISWHQNVFLKQILFFSKKLKEKSTFS